MIKMASGRQDKTKSGSLSGSNMIENDRSFELPKIVGHRGHEGSVWNNNNPAIRQLSALFRVRSAPKYYPLGLWQHQKDVDFPDIRDSCLITAGQRHGSRSSTGLAASVEKVHLILQNLTNSHQIDNNDPSINTDQWKTDNIVDNDPAALSGDRISSGSTVANTDPRKLPSALSKRKRPRARLVRRKRVEFTDEMLPRTQNEATTSSECETEPMIDVKDRDVRKEEESDDRRSSSFVRDDIKLTTTGSDVISRSEDLTSDCNVEKHSSRKGISKEKFPPINTIYICLIIGQGRIIPLNPVSGVTTQIKTDLEKVLSKCRLRLLDNGYDLEITTLDVKHLSNLDPNISQDILKEYLDQCRSHGLGPFYYVCRWCLGPFSCALMDSDEEDNDPPLMIPYDDYEHLVNEAGKRESLDDRLLGDWYKLDNSVDPSVYRLKTIENVLQTSPDDEFLRTSRSSRTGDVLENYGNPDRKTTAKAVRHGSDDDTFRDQISTEKDPIDDDDVPLSRSFMEFMEDVIKMVKIINERRIDGSRETSHAVSRENWPHRRNRENRIPESFIRTSTTLTNRIREAMLDPNNDMTVVIRAESEEMRSILVSHLAKLVRDWITPSPVVIVQYAGLTEITSRLDDFIETLFTEVSASYGYDTRLPNTRDIVQYAKSFRILLNKVSRQDGPERPLVLLLDGVDVSADGDWWLPKELPANVYIVLTVSSDLSESVPINLLKMDPVESEDNGRQLFTDQLMSDIQRAEVLFAERADIVRDVLCLLAVYENGLTERDIVEALVNAKPAYAVELGRPDLAQFWPRCLRSLLPSWIRLAYDSGKLLYRIPKGLHSRVLGRYMKDDDDSSVSKQISDYRDAVAEALGRPLEFARNLIISRSERDGLAVLLKWRLLAFIRNLSRCTSSDLNRDILKNTLFNFSWLGSYLHHLPVGDFVRIIWPLRHLGKEIKGVCAILESQLTDATDVDTVACGVLVCLDRNSASALLVHLYDTAKDWLINGGTSLIPCCPTLVMPRNKYTSLPGPASVLHALPDNLIVTWGPDHGLQVWDMESTTCHRHQSQTTHWPVFDTAVNDSTKTVYYTEETQLIGWNISDGNRVLKVDLLPHVSETGRTFDIEKDKIPFLSVADVSEDGQLIAVKINHSEMLLDNKGIVIVSPKDGGTVVGAVGDGLFGRNATNIRFNRDGSILVVTRKLSMMEDKPGISFFSSNPPVGEISTETRADRGFEANTASDSDKQEKIGMDESDDGASKAVVEVGDTRNPEELGSNQAEISHNTSDSGEKELNKPEMNSDRKSGRSPTESGNSNEVQRSDSDRNLNTTTNMILPEDDASEDNQDTEEDIIMKEAEHNDPDGTDTGTDGLKRNEGRKIRNLKTNS
ncbi:hypothetical protein LSH36_83g04000 [Paralvinella palmiformis]|uniref:Uncharacterized protein n=1 Tax=Paralvinella palmiformis TaxID=53620 RepID=A0AAD9K392_9ANNE|nr:hypothetical protein LSH36_83g04000 [Paralvinella palmiformis]